MARHTDFTKEVDKYIGSRIQEARLVSGLSRQQLAGKIGVTHQQLQKYEKGINRICIGRLLIISHALNRDITFFVEGLSENKNRVLDFRLRQTIELVRNFNKLSYEMQNAFNVMMLAFIEAQENPKKKAA